VVTLAPPPSGGTRLWYQMLASTQFSPTLYHRFGRSCTHNSLIRQEVNYLPKAQTNGRGMLSLIRWSLWMKSVGNDRKYALSFPIIFFTRKRYGNDMLENDTNNEKSIHPKWNHQIEYMSILIDNGTSNRKHQNHEWAYMQHVHNKMSDRKSNMNITTSYAHIITTCDSQLLNSAANKVMSQQLTYRLSCCRQTCPQARDCEWRLKLYT
jgi:hypothetical protein